MNKSAGNSVTTVTITQDEYGELCEGALMLAALNEAGVDNWEGYAYAQELYAKMVDEYEEEE